jgi:hypothetical protein
MKRPPWIARNQRDRNQMIEWTTEQLEILRADTEEKNSFGPGDLGKYLTLLAGQYGNMQPLHATYPHLAPFLQAPKRGRGKYPRETNLAVERAAAEVSIIRALWQKHYGKKNRHADDGPSAVEIAAERWGVDPADIERALK